MIPERLSSLLGVEGVPMRIAAAFSDAGHEVFLVGGSVRDALMGREPETPDYDFATAASPEETESILNSIARSVVTIGKEFGTIGCFVGAVPVEVTTFRSEIYRDESRKPAEIGRASCRERV